LSKQKKKRSIQWVMGALVVGLAVVAWLMQSGPPAEQANESGAETRPEAPTVATRLERAVNEFNKHHGSTVTANDLGAGAEDLERYNQIVRQWMARSQQYGNPPQTCDQLAGWVCAANETVFRINESPTRLDFEDCLVRFRRQIRNDPAASDEMCQKIFFKNFEALDKLDASYQAMGIRNPDIARKLNHDPKYVINSMGFAASLIHAGRPMLLASGVQVHNPDAPAQRAYSPPPKSTDPCEQLGDKCAVIATKRARLLEKGILNLRPKERKRYLRLDMNIRFCSDYLGGAADLKRLLGSKSKRVRKHCKRGLRSIK